MAFFAGLAGRGAAALAGPAGGRLGVLATTHGGGGRPRVWTGDGAALVQAPRDHTPEDRFDRLPGRFAGGRSVLVFDGRLDNREDLLAALAVEPRAAAMLGDGGLVMSALERWGEDACPRLIGSFAFAWWDTTARRLLLACDAVGGRAIYAHDGPDGLCFATRPLAVLGFPEVPRAVDERAMAYPLLGRPIPAEMTPFRHVFRLPPAGRLVWRDGRHAIDRYWRPDLGHRIHYRRDGDYVDAARDLLDRVVKAQLRSTGPAVCMLSGGLDSSAVTSTAARLLTPGTVHALTCVPSPDADLPAVPPGLFFDEAPLAAATVARHPNIVPHVLPAGALTREEIDPARLFWEIGLPQRNFLNFGEWQPLYAKARELGAASVLDGSAGNFTLSWQSTALLADLAASGRFLELSRQLIGLRRHGQRPWPEIRNHLLPYLAPTGLRRLWRRRHGPGGWWRHSAASAALAADMDAATLLERVRIPVDRPERDRRLRAAILEEHWARTQWTAALPYATGVELRDPLGDRRLVEFCLAVPATLWQSDGVPRSFARQVLGDRLPRAVIGTQERGRQSAAWFQRLTSLRETFMTELERLDASPAARQMIDLPRLKSIGEDWPADADAAQARVDELLGAFARGIHYGRFIRWVEGSNG